MRQCSQCSIEPLERAAAVFAQCRPCGRRELRLLQLAQAHMVALEQVERQIQPPRAAVLAQVAQQIQTGTLDQTMEVLKPLADMVAQNRKDVERIQEQLSEFVSQVVGPAPPAPLTDGTTIPPANSVDALGAIPA